MVLIKAIKTQTGEVMLKAIIYGVKLKTLLYYLSKEAFKHPSCSK